MAQEWAALEADLRKHDAAYRSGTPAVSDAHFDELVERLRDASGGTAPFLAELGPKPRQDDAVQLPFWVGSLDKVVGAAVTQRLARADPRSDVVISDKLDGVSCVYERRGGRARLLTRGNGSVGQDITRLCPHIQGIPSAVLPGVETVLVRGELVISRAVFEADFAAEFSNMRNLVAGCVNSKVVKLRVARAIVFVAYEIPSHAPVMALGEQMRCLGRAPGAVVVTHRVRRVSDLTYDALLSLYAERRGAGEYDVDGLVVATDDAYALPADSNPKHAFAFKDPSLCDARIVEVASVTWDVSRYGRLTPVVHFAPVHLAGVMVGRATAHNHQFVVDHGIGVGARITVCRSGDVIPKIVDVVSRGDACAPDVAHWVDGPHAYRADGLCPAKRLHHFLAALDIKNAGPAACAKLQAAGVATPRAVAALTAANMAAHCGTKAGSNVPADLREAVRGADEWKLLSATGAFGAGIGDRILRAIAAKYPTRPFIELTAADMCSVDGVGGARAAQVVAGIQAALEYVDGMERGVPRVAPVAAVVPRGAQAFAGERVVFTGVRDKALEQLIAAHGGTVVSGGKRATVLVVADDEYKPSAKSADALLAGARVMTVDALRAALPR
jgi:NAD-dependent DNA ligase